MSTLNKLRALAKAALERAEKATPGPWCFALGDRLSGDRPMIVRELIDAAGEKYAGGHYCIALCGLELLDRRDPQDIAYVDARFIAAARTDVPALASGIEKLAAIVEAARDYRQTMIAAKPYLDAGSIIALNRMEVELGITPANIEREEAALDAALRALEEK